MANDKNTRINPEETAKSEIPCLIKKLVNSLNPSPYPFPLTTAIILLFPARCFIFSTLNSKSFESTSNTFNTLLHLSSSG